MTEVDFSTLLGTHVLDTAAVESTVAGHPDSASHFSFGMGGRVYTATEDPSDGYRSYCEKIVVSDDKTLLKGAAPLGRVVHVTQEIPDKYRNCDILVFTDAETGHVWMRLGTDNTDDYYPFCVFEWNAMPKNTNTNTSGATGLVLPEASQVAAARKGGE